MGRNEEDQRGAKQYVLAARLGRHGETRTRTPEPAKPAATWWAILDLNQ